MTRQDPKATPSPEVAAYYEQYPEESRLDTGASQLEFERTKEILSRVLPKPPARILDVGGAAGAYSAWLAERGYEAHLVDVSPRLVEEARRRNAKRARPIASLSVADARSLSQEDGWAAGVLLMGPLYHLPAAEDRMVALREAHRVLAAPGVAVVAAISRYASALDGMSRKFSLDPRFVEIRDRDLADGQHRNETGIPHYFTTAYFHRPEDLRAELLSARFVDVEILGVEGPGWLLADFDARWADEGLRKDMLDVARALESQPSIVGVSGHLLGVGWKR
jgi:SAM-dependent methyltransferase